METENKDWNMRNLKDDERISKYEKEEIDPVGEKSDDGSKNDKESGEQVRTKQIKGRRKRLSNHLENTEHNENFNPQLSLREMKKIQYYERMFQRMEKNRRGGGNTDSKSKKRFSKIEETNTNIMNNLNEQELCNISETSKSFIGEIEENHEENIKKEESVIIEGGKLCNSVQQKRNKKRKKKSGKKKKKKNKYMHEENAKNEGRNQGMKNVKERESRKRIRNKNKKFINKKNKKSKINKIKVLHDEMINNTNTMDTMFKSMIDMNSKSKKQEESSSSSLQNESNELTNFLEVAIREKQKKKCKDSTEEIDFLLGNFDNGYISDSILYVHKMEASLMKTSLDQNQQGLGIRFYPFNWNHLLGGSEKGESLNEFFRRIRQKWVHRNWLCLNRLYEKFQFSDKSSNFFEIEKRRICSVLRNKESKESSEYIIENNHNELEEKESFKKLESREMTEEIDSVEPVENRKNGLVYIYKANNETVYDKSVNRMKERNENSINHLQINMLQKTTDKDKYTNEQKIKQKKKQWKEFLSNTKHIFSEMKINKLFNIQKKKKRSTNYSAIIKRNSDFMKTCRNKLNHDNFKKLKKLNQLSKKNIKLYVNRCVNIINQDNFDVLLKKMNNLLK